MLIGDARSLGLKHKNNIKNLPEHFVGKIFSRLIVLSLNSEKRYKSGNNTTRELVFNVQCDCGKIFTVGQRRLSDGRSAHCRSCGSTNALKINPGDKFNRWQVVEKLGNKNGNIHYKCICECGNSGSISGSQLKKNKSHGCLDCGNKDKIKHGRSFTAEYRTWNSMRERCRNPKQKQFSDYGGRGISVCERWDKSFAHFLEDMEEKIKGKRISIDRIDNEGNYEPGNCRWSTPQENTNNRRNSKKNRDKYMYILKEKLCENCRNINGK